MTAHLLGVASPAPKPAHQRNGGELSVGRASCSRDHGVKECDGRLLVSARIRNAFVQVATDAAVLADRSAESRSP